MTPGERKMTQMLLALARSVRRGRNADPDLVKAAAMREQQFQADLDSEPELQLLAAEAPAEYRDEKRGQG